jgi:DNA mismatch repair protein MutS
MLAQYQAIKRAYGSDVILLFRLGDFYEMFGEDARIASQALELVLTSREVGKGRRIAMCGLPHHALDRYLTRLLAAGHKAAICDQVEDPKQAKGLVRREVTRVLTPGTVVEEFLLDPARSNYLASLAFAAEGAGLALLESSTGDFRLTELHGPDWQSRLQSELARLQPSECLLSPAEAEDPPREALLAASGAQLTPWEPEEFLTRSPSEILTRHFGTESLRGFGCEEMPLAVRAAAAAICYLAANQKTALAQVRSLSTYSLTNFMVVDATTRRNLELTHSLLDGSPRNTLLALLDQTRTPMGARLLREWLLAPQLDLAEIQRRQQAVQAFREDDLGRGSFREGLKAVRDLERLLARAAAASITPRELGSLRDSLLALPALLSLLEARPAPLAALAASADRLADLAGLLLHALVEDPPATAREGGMIRAGYHAELDSLRQATREGKDWIAGLQERERARTGIKSLRVGFNQVFGYYLEVTRPNLARVPADYVRRQTMVNAERFLTPELKQWEDKILGAEERSLALEGELFAQLRAEVTARADRLQATARALARADVLAALAEVAARRGYVQPVVEEGDGIEIRAGRHPVVEVAQAAERFVPNDAQLDCDQDQLIILTGPNMAGKSTYLRQVALIVLLAQIGSFVPAEAARVGLVDRIFTRVGASDDLASGRSTFLVEMTETANILHNATRRSLIILDEIGRGTSTFDGLSLAWAIAEQIHNHPRLGAKTLFATHYHQLNELADHLPRARNFRILVREQGDRIIFLRKIVPGGTDRSYGIQVARLAGLPPEVIERAKQVLWSLEQSDHLGAPALRPRPLSPPPSAEQLPLFGERLDPILEELKSLDVNEMTPLEALAKLADLQRKLKKNSTDAR